MQNSDTFIVAREGWKFLIAALAAYTLFMMVDLEWLQLAILAGGAVLAYIYRNPERIVPHYQSGSIVSVADGRVAAIETVEAGPTLEAPCYRVEIVSSTFDTSLLRMPFEGTLHDVTLRRGSRLPLNHPLAESLNEMAELSFEDAQGHRCCVEHRLDSSIDALSLHARDAQHLPQGGRYGVMVKGSHALYLPAQSRVAVKIGDEVRAGETLIGYFS